jgi:aldose 1-epimerase
VSLGNGATLWVNESYGYLMIFTGDGLADVDRRSIAVEPMTCAPNAFRSGDGLIRLEPGESHVGLWGIIPAPR